MNALQAIESLSQKDLDEITEMIRDQEAKLERLRAQQRMIKMALGLWRAGGHLKGSQRGKSSETPAEPQMTKFDEYRLSVKKYVMANGPASQSAISKQCGIPAGSMTAVLKHPWFTFTAKGVELTGKAY